MLGNEPTRPNEQEKEKGVVDGVVEEQRRRGGRRRTGRRNKKARQVRQRQCRVI